MFQMGKMIFVIIILLIARESQATDLQVPQTFGIMTMTYARGGDNSMFEGHLARYATMDCPIITEVNIVWNNEKTPEQMEVFKNSQDWKRPVYFHLTPYNSLNWRYKIPKESKERVYFYVDDDNIVECEELTKGFKMWQAHAIGQLGPIVSYHIRHFEYTNGKKFSYGSGPKDYYSIGLLSSAFVSAHLMELYYADLWELEEVRKIVSDKNNCEDIALDFIVSFFYPQLLTKYFPGKTQGLQGKVGVSKTANHMRYRSQCVNQFTYIFGLNSFRFQPIKDRYPNAKRWSLPFLNQTLLAKKKYFERNVLHKYGIIQKVESMPIQMPIPIPMTSVLAPTSEYALPIIVLAVFSILMTMALWRMKKELYWKSKNSRFLNIQIDQFSISGTQRSPIKNEANIQ